MRSKGIYFIIAVVIIIAALMVFQYVFSIYEVDIEISSGELYADYKSECVIRTVPLNSFGMKIPFRQASAEITIPEGKDLIEILELDEQKGFIRIRALGRAGKVSIYIKPEKALLPSSYEIIINPNIT